MGTNLSWPEPIAVKRLRLSKTDPWYPNRVNAALRIAAFLAILYAVFQAIAPYFHWPIAVNYWLTMLFIAIAGGIFFGLLRPWLCSFMESQIVISRMGINRNSIVLSPVGTRIEFWPWTDVAELVVEPLSLENESFSTLVIHDERNKVIGTIGLAPQISAKNIESAMSELERDVRVFDRI